MYFCSDKKAKMMKTRATYLTEQIIKRMRNDNPWWFSNAIPQEFHEMRHRLYLDSFYQEVSNREIRRGVILMGPRRIGKTVMIYHTIDRLIEQGIPSQQIIYLSIDTPIYNNIALEELFSLAKEALNNEYAKDDYYVVYDEIQYLKDWEVHLKSLIDTFRNVKFIASGSAAAALKMKSNESGAGRFTDFMLPPLTFNEYIHLLDLNNIITKKPEDSESPLNRYVDTLDIGMLNRHFIDYINYGGYPEIVFSERMRQNPGQYIRHDIVDKVLLRDLPSLYGIQDTQELNRLFIYIAYHSGEEFSYEVISKESEIKKEVLKKYLMYLEAAFLINIVYKVDANAKNMQRITAFKIYLTNPSLRCALFSPLTETDPAIGGMVETAIFAQWLQKRTSLIYYANWNKGPSPGEVDIVGIDIAKQKADWAVEVKWSDRYFDKPTELKSLLYFMENNHLERALVTTLTKRGIKQLKKVRLEFVPAAIYAYTVGHNRFKTYNRVDF